MDDGARPRLGYRPGLDGLRALAVVAVLLYHAGFGWMGGGYLGVSTFFTLSGFLITSLLIDEARATHAVEVTRFWVRRSRRLMPAAILTIAAVAVASVWLATPSQRAMFRGDGLAALGEVANWRYFFAGEGYARQFQAPSPLLHFWSLAIEEQFYLCFPLLVAWRVRRGGNVRRSVAGVTAALLAGSVVAVIVWGGSRVAYYNTAVRAAEILVGCLLAVLVPGLRLDRPSRRTALTVAGVAGLGASVWAWSAAGSPSSFVASGGTLAYAVASAAVVAAAAHTNAVASALSLRPLRWLGRISYGVYLFHFPIFLWLTGDRLGVHGLLPLTAVRVALTLAAAALSYRFLESPIRHGRVLPSRRFSIAVAPTAVVTVAALAFLTTLHAPKQADPFAVARGQLSRVTAAAPGAPRIGVFGDSTALMMAPGLGDWGDETRRLTVVGGAPRIGCGIVRYGTVRNGDHTEDYREKCGDWVPVWEEQLRLHTMDAAVILTGPWDIFDRRLPGTDRFAGPGDPAYDRYLTSELDAAARFFTDRGIPVVFLTSPHVHASNPDNLSEPVLPASVADRRVDRLDEIIRGLPAGRPGVHVVDLARHLRSAPGGEFALRPDEVHFTAETSRQAARWIGPQVVAALRTHDGRR